MKFGQLPIGRRFLYRGDEYLKVSPLQAQRPGEDRQRLIPRSAPIEPLESTDPPAPVDDAPIDPLRLAEVMDRLGAEIADLITGSGLDAAQSTALLAQVRQAFLRARQSLHAD
ncbi:MAG: hypothetical protein D6720_09580 [Gammaproteobacteria bacterium]|nr:MAG: hypothetical protein D6720_09580 [Gammaproteobacteria bacterium]